MGSNYTVKFGRPTYPVIGKNKDIVRDHEPIFTSKCGRFRIEKHMMSSKNGYFCSPEYRVFRVSDGKRLGTVDLYRDARDICEMEVNPDWDG